MRGASILLRSGSTYTLTHVTSLLRAAGNEVIAHDNDEQCRTVIEAGGVDAVVADWCSVCDQSAIVAACNRHRVPLILAGDDIDGDAIELLCHGNIDHVIWGYERAPAIATAIEKLLRNNYFGLEKYVAGFGVESYHVQLRDGDSVRTVCREVAALLDTLRTPTPIRDAIIKLSRELADNALYTSPRDASGRRRYTPIDRQSGIKVAPHEEARFTYCFDGRRLYVAAMDSFGSLATTRVRSKILRSQRIGSRRHPTDAPIATGLELALECSSELVFNVVQDVATEVICACDLYDEPKWRGIHFFGADDRQIVETADSSESIHVSESLLIDIRGQFARSPTQG